MPLRQWLVLIFQSITLGAGMAVAVAGACHSWLGFWISLLPLSAVVFFAIMPWPGDESNQSQ